MSCKKEPTKPEMNDPERDQETSSSEASDQEESLGDPSEDPVPKTDSAAAEKPENETTSTPPRVAPTRCGSPLLRGLISTTPPPRTGSTPPKPPSELENALGSTPPRTASTPPKPSSELLKALTSPLQHPVPSELSLQPAGVPAAAPSVSSPVNVRRILPGYVGGNIAEGSVAPGNFSGSIQGEGSERGATGTKRGAAVPRGSAPEVQDSAAERGSAPEVHDAAAEGGSAPEVQDSAAEGGSSPEVQDLAAEGGSVPEVQGSAAAESNKVLKKLLVTPTEGNHVPEAKREPVAQDEITEVEIKGDVSVDGQDASVDNGTVPEAEQMEVSEGDGCAKGSSEEERMGLDESAKATERTSDRTGKDDPNWKKPIDAARMHKANTRLGAMNVQDSPSRRSARLKNMNQTPSDSPNLKKERKTLRSETQERVSSDENISGRTRGQAGRLCSTSSNSEVDNSGDEGSKGSKGKRRSRKDPKK